MMKRAEKYVVEKKIIELSGQDNSPDDNSGKTLAPTIVTGLN